MTVKIGNRAFKATRELRHRVEVLRAAGFLEDGIAIVLEISEPTLRKYFRRELDNGAVRANARVALAVHEAAMAGSPAAARLWRDGYAALDTRAQRRVRRPPALGKKEKQQQESEQAAQGTSWAELLGEAGSDRPN
jgi:hypothetical protein